LAGRRYGELEGWVEQREEEIQELELLTRPGHEDELRTFLLLLHPADLAELVDDVSPETAKSILRALDPERAAKMLAEVDPEEQERILRLIKPSELAPIVSEMATDDVTDLLQELDEKTAERVLATLPVEERADVARLLEYDPDTAGGIMQTELVAVPIASTIGEAIEAVREAAQEIDIINVFVVDGDGRYAGHLALQDLVLKPAKTQVEKVMEPKVVEVTPDLDQEEVARIFDRYSLVELGVVDKADGRLIGRITADDIHEVLVEEAEEDMLKMAGAGDEPEVIYSDKVLRIVGQRLPWLASTFCAGLLATWILNSASVVFHTAVILLTFVPVITGMSGNVGTQSAMIMIQGMAVGRVDRSNLAKEILKDLTVCVIMAATCGVLVALIVSTWKGNPALGLCVGLALACSMSTASLLGSSEPAVLKRFGIDPAVAAGPLITSMNDITGVLIYTVVSIMFLGYIR
jgi:magnesium transporter